MPMYVWNDARFPEGYRQSDRVYEWQVGGNRQRPWAMFLRVWGSHNVTNPILPSPVRQLLQVG